jgi:hypothetical protein
MGTTTQIGSNRLTVNGGITSNNNSIDAGTGTVICGSLNASGLITANNGLNVCSGFGLTIYDVVAKTNLTNIFTYTDGNSYYDNGKVGGNHTFRYNNQAGSITTMLNINTSAITATPTITANGGLTVPASQTLTVNGSLTGNTITASGLITASAGLTIPSGQSLTANGGISTTTLSASGIATFSGKINANNGVYLGTGKNYVLQDPTSYVRPFNNANGCTLGFTFSAAITGTTFVNLTTTARTNIVSLDLSAGTYLIQYNVNNFGGLSGSPNYTSTYWIVGIATTSAASSGYDIDYSMDQSSASYTGNNTKSNMTVYTSIASFTVYLVSQITASATVRTQGFINATRIQ